MNECTRRFVVLSVNVFTTCTIQRQINCAVLLIWCAIIIDLFPFRCRVLKCIVTFEWIERENCVGDLNIVSGKIKLRTTPAVWFEFCCETHTRTVWFQSSHSHFPVQSFHFHRKVSAVNTHSNAHSHTHTQRGRLHSFGLLAFVGNELFDI